MTFLALVIGLNNGVVIMIQWPRVHSRSDRPVSKKRYTPWYATDWAIPESIVITPA